ncbi:MAG: M20/M25/M40 family metallo-hydrolase [Bryobacterales bacterium]|nr:M20/M25/M40 family metallo-hydrolase [Bryobacterales bacterium]
MRLFGLAAITAALWAASPSPADRWWKHVEFLASDHLQGRATGSPGYEQAAQYVAAQMTAAGLRPCGASGYRQPLRLVERRLIEDQSKLALVSGDKDIPLKLGDDAVLSTRVQTEWSTPIPLVFVGYGLSIPERNYDDYRGQDVKGKIAVYIAGSPAHIPGPLRAHFSSLAERAKALRAAGAVGTLMIPNPKTTDVPWSRAKLTRLQPTMALADTSTDDAKGLRFSASLNPDRAGLVFENAPTKLQELLDLATAGKPLPGFALPFSLRAQAVVEKRDVVSENLCGILPGAGPTLKSESVVLSAHLDHLGRGGAINGDEIYNGAMDNASGIATLIEVARLLRTSKTKPRRNIAFVAVTGEEKGMLGSKYFATHPTVPSIVANINFDMYLPLHALKTVMVLGLDESTMRKPLDQVCARLGLKVQPDMEPQRNRFIRSDQYSFIQQGVPALALKFGYELNTPEHELQKQWVAKRYHAPSDDLTQTVDKQAAAQFNRLIEELALTLANQSERPRWNDTSFFKRFAK